MYTVIRLNNLEVKEFNHDELDKILKYIDNNLFSFPYNISKFKSSILIEDNDLYKLIICGLTKIEIAYFELQYTNV